MKILKHFLLSLVLVTTGITPVDAMKRAQPDSSFDAGATEPVEKKARLASQAIHPEVQFTAYDPEYFALINEELKNLESFLNLINSNDRYLNGNSVDTTSLEITSSDYIKSLVPMLYQLLTSKINLMAQRMHIDALTFKISITFNEPIEGVINASGNFQKHEVLFSNKLLKLFVWHEGSNDYSAREGLLDATIGHELAHIIYQHEYSCIVHEYLADQTSANHLEYPIHMISSNFIVSLTATFLSSLLQYGNVYLNKDDKLSIACIVSSALIKKYPDLAALGNCSLVEFVFNVNSAISAIHNLAYSKKYSSYALVTGKQLDEADKRHMCSRIYEQLVACCIQPKPLPDGRSHISGIISHPSPCKRKAHIMGLFEEKNCKQSLAF